MRTYFHSAYDNMEELYKLILGAFAKLPKVTVSLVMSVCPSFRQSALKNSAPTG